MPAIKKFTLLFGFNPDPQAWGVEVAGRSGGWSESWWFPNSLNGADRTTLAETRAGLMTTDCGIVGWRETPYTYNGNKLIPGHADVGALFVRGALGGQVNSPDDALRIRGRAAAVPISWYWWIHAIPDYVIQSAQYVPDPIFELAWERFRTNLQGGGILTQVAQWLGRDATQIAARVTKIDGVAKTVTTQQTTGAIAGVDFLRMRRVYDDQNLPIQGTFFVTLVTPNPDGTVTYTLQGFPNRSRTTPSGTARVDKIAVSPMTSNAITLVGERKVGRPSSLRRGRRTKVRR
jgi:hypothetical protein